MYLKSDILFLVFHVVCGLHYDGVRLIPGTITMAQAHDMTSRGFCNSSACRCTQDLVSVDGDRRQGIQSTKKHAYACISSPTTRLGVTIPHLCGCLRYCDWECNNATHLAYLVQADVLLQQKAIHRGLKLFHDGFRSARDYIQYK